MIGWLGIPAGAIAWGFALYVLLVAPSTLASRLLVSMLVIDGIAVVSSYSNSYYLTVLGLSELNWWQVHQASDWAATFLVNVLFPLEMVSEGTVLYGLIPMAYAIAVIVYVPLVAYGMLRTQLFDIDLRLKRTLNRSTIAATFVAVFFLVSELAGMYLSSQLGNLLGAVCTAGLVFFLDRIQRAAESLTDAAMPRTRAAPEYETYRKLQVYEAALQAALQGDGISDKERQMLDSMIASLGIDNAAARQLEYDLQAGVPAGH